MELDKRSKSAINRRARVLAASAETMIRHRLLQAAINLPDGTDIDRWLELQDVAPGEQAGELPI